MGDSGSEDSIYHVLQSDILDLRLRPGMVISIRDISDVYGTGRTPVRDALIQLSKEGLITFLPQRGTMISGIHLEKADNERFLRACVEEPVMAEFMRSCPEEAVARLNASIDTQKELIGDGDCRGFLEEDIVFHRIFYEYTGKMHCDHIINANSGDYRRIRLLALTESGISDAVISQHEEIVDCILKKDEARLHERFLIHLGRLACQEEILRDKHPDLFCGGELKERRKNDGLSADFLEEMKLR